MSHVINVKSAIAAASTPCHSQITSDTCDASTVVILKLNSPFELEEPTSTAFANEHGKLVGRIVVKDDISVCSFNQDSVWSSVSEDYHEQIHGKNMQQVDDGSYKVDGWKDATRSSNLDCSSVSGLQVKNRRESKSGQCDVKLNNLNACNSFKFTTACAPDASAFQFQCQSCNMVRFSAYWKLRLHEDWCGRRMQSETGVSCQSCGFRYKNLVLLCRHAREVHGSNANIADNFPLSRKALTYSNPYNFTTACASDAVEFPYLCASCCTVCFQCQEDLNRHEEWCGRSLESRGFDCSKCNSSFQSDILLKKHKLRECVGRAFESSSDNPSATITDFDLGVCPICNEQLGSSSETRIHFQSVHHLNDYTMPNLVRSLMSSSTFRCSQCGTSFETDLLLTKHKQSKKLCQQLCHSSSTVEANDPHARQTKSNREKKCKVRTGQSTQYTSKKGSICCLVCNHSFASRLLLMQHKRSGSCVEVGQSVDALLLSDGFERSIGQKKANRFSKMSSNTLEVVASLSCKHNRSRCTAILEPNNVPITNQHKMSDDKLVKDKLAVRSSKRLRKETCISSHCDVKKYKLDSVDTRVIKNLCVHEVSSQTKPPVANVAAKDTKGAQNNVELDSNSNRNMTTLNSTYIKNSQVRRCGVRHNEDNSSNQVSHCVEQCKTNRSTGNTVSTSKLKSGKGGAISVIEVDQTDLLRALNLVPINGSIGDAKDGSKNVLPRRSCRRSKQKTVWTKFDVVRYRKPVFKKGTNDLLKASDKGAESAPVDPVSKPYNKPTSLSKPCSLQLAKKTNEVKTNRNSDSNKRKLPEKQKRDELLNNVKSLRTLEVVNENKLRCVTCGVVLKTVRQVCAHVCQH